MNNKTGYNLIDVCQPQHCIASKIMKSHRIINGIFRKHLKEFGITNSQMSILFVLSKKGQTTQTELSEMLFLEKSSISRNMKRLFEKNYVSKKEFPQLNITDNGLQLVENIIPHWDNAMNEVSNQLTNNGVEALDIVLKNLVTK